MIGGALRSAGVSAGSYEQQFSDGLQSWAAREFGKAELAVLWSALIAGLTEIAVVEPAGRQRYVRRQLLSPRVIVAFGGIRGRKMPAGTPALL